MGDHWYCLCASHHLNQKLGWRKQRSSDEKITEDCKGGDLIDPVYGPAKLKRPKRPNRRVVTVCYGATRKRCKYLYRAVVRPNDLGSGVALGNWHQLKWHDHNLGPVRLRPAIRSQLFQNNPPDLSKLRQWFSRYLLQKARHQSDLACCFKYSTVNAVFEGNCPQLQCMQGYHEHANLINAAEAVCAANVATI